jgi:hypothetical protein
MKKQWCSAEKGKTMKPEDGDLYGWDKFAVLCEREGVGLEYKGDWEPWWVFWKQGFITAMNT